MPSHTKTSKEVYAFVLICMISHCHPCLSNFDDLFEGEGVGLSNFFVLGDQASTKVQTRSPKAKNMQIRRRSNFQNDGWTTVEKES